MKTKYFFLFAVLGILVGCKNGSEKTSLRIVIDRNTTKDDLEGLIESLQSTNINLKVNEYTFNENGELDKIKGEVEFPHYANATFNSEKVGKIIIEHDINVKEGGFSVKVRNRWF